jgi:hypothetical protein
MKFKINNEIEEKIGFPGYIYSIISIKKINNEKTLVDIVLCK